MKTSKLDKITKVGEQEVKVEQDTAPHRLSMDEAAKQIFELVHRLQLSPQQVYMLGAHMQLTANEMAISGAIDTLGAAMVNELNKRTGMPKKTLQERQAEQAEIEKAAGIIRVKPE